MKIVSLIPSATEIICALGFRNELVGVSHECDFPEGLNARICTKAKIKVEGSSKEIHESVESLVVKSLSLYEVLTNELRDLQPDIIVTQDQCDVCAVSLEDVEKAVEDLVGFKCQIISLSPVKLENVWDDILRVAIGLKVDGKDVVNDLKERVLSIKSKVKDFDTPTVATIEWIEPLMAAGNWVPELVELAGGANLFGTVGKHSPWMEFKDLVEKDPEIIIIMPCGFNIEKTTDEMKVLTVREEWYELKAVKNQHVYVTDGNQYFNRPGPRLVESVEILAEIIHPSKVDFGHEGKGWAKF
jgi:iron complex transport system substrate-binding protein